VELRSSPTPEGRCCLLARPGDRGAGQTRCDPHRPRRVGAAGAHRRVAAGARPSCDPHRPRRVGAARVALRCWLGPVDVVAILTDPGGSVLRQSQARLRCSSMRLRSSPTPEGRCYPVPLTWSPPPTRWCCDPHRPRRVGAAHGDVPPGPEVADDVAILTDPGGSVLLTARRHRLGQHHVGCDPHRPRRVGAAP